MATSTSSVSGLVSGLDTATIVSQLMQIEAQPQTDLKNQQAQVQSSVTALQSIQTKLTTLSTAAGKLQRATNWAAGVATSSDSTIATAAVSTGATNSQLSFTVDRLATTHGVATAQDVSATSTTIASTGSIVLTVGGTAHNLSVGGGSLNEVAAAVNSANLGVRASVVNTGSGYRLQLNATSSGAAAAFSVSGFDGTSGGSVVTTQGVDAQLTLGSGAGAYQVTSSSNTFSGIAPGVTVTALKKSDTAVQITTQSDPGGLADNVQALVDAANSVLGEITTDTAYDASTKTAGVLNGDYSMRRVSQSIINSITAGVNQSNLKSPALAGVSVDKNGQVTFDRTKFLAAYTADPKAVESLFTQHATTTGSVAFVYAGDGVKAGTYDVNVDAVGVTTIGTIGGATATGSSSSLAVVPTDPKLGGLTISFIGSATGTIGTISYEPGLAQRLVDALKTATDTQNGYVKADVDSRNSQVTRLQKTIDDYGVRLAQHEAALKAQYAALETALGTLKSQGDSLTSALASLTKTGG